MFWKKKESKKDQIDPYKLFDANIEAIKAFAGFGVNAGPVPIYIANQEQIQTMRAIDRVFIGLPEEKETYWVDGVYDSKSDVITLDKEFYESENQKEVKKTLIHEYGHRVSLKYFDRLEELFSPKKEQKIKENQKLITSGRKEVEFDPVKEINERLRNRDKDNLVEDEIRKYEFCVYFEEMFAESVALYLTKELNGESKLKNHCDLYLGNVFGEDKKFVGKLEKFLTEAFYDRLFQKGLKHVILELSKTRNFTDRAFQKRYQKKLN